MRVSGANTCEPRSAYSRMMSRFTACIATRPRRIFTTRIAVNGRSNHEASGVRLMLRPKTHGLSGEYQRSHSHAFHAVTKATLTPGPCASEQRYSLLLTGQKWAHDKLKNAYCQKLFPATSDFIAVLIALEYQRSEIIINSEMSIVWPRPLSIVWDMSYPKRCLIVKTYTLVSSMSHADCWGESCI